MNIFPLAIIFWSACVALVGWVYRDCLDELSVGDWLLIFSTAPIILVMIAADHFMNQIGPEE